MALVVAIVAAACLWSAKTASAESQRYDTPVLVSTNVDETGHSTYLGGAGAVVATNAPRYEARVAEVGGTAVVGAGNMSGDPEGEPFYISLWGYLKPDRANLFQISARACPDSTGRGCDPWVDLGSPVSVSDATPQVVFPTDAAIDSDDSYLVQVTDPAAHAAIDGAGELWAVWKGNAAQIGDRSGRPLDLAWTLPWQLNQGVGTVRILRCNRTNFTGLPTEDKLGHCTDYGISQEIEVDRSLSTVGSILDSTIGSNSGQVGLRLESPDDGEFSVSWEVVDSDGAEVAHGETERVQAAPAGACADPPVDTCSPDVPVYASDLSLHVPTGLTAGGYEVRGTATRHTPRGDFESPLTGNPTFNVDDTGPTIGTVTADHSSFYPSTDGYRDSITITADGQNEAWRPATFQVLDADADAVRTESVDDSTPGTTTFTWDGRDDSGRQVPEGQYRVRVTPHDEFANPGETSTSDPVTVEAERLIQRRWSVEVSASASRVAAQVGRCSRVRRPAAHGWVGSLGLVSASRCRGANPADRLVRTVHQVRLPDLPSAVTPGHYDDISVTAYGGGATRSARDTANLRYLTARNVGTASHTLPAPVGYHAGPFRIAAPLIRAGKTVRWDVRVSGGHRYDIRTFLVRLTYTVLQ